MTTQSPNDEPTRRDSERGTHNRELIQALRNELELITQGLGNTEELRDCVYALGRDDVRACVVEVYDFLCQPELIPNLDLVDAIARIGIELGEWEIELLELNRILEIGEKFAEDIEDPACQAECKIARARNFERLALPEKVVELARESLELLRPLANGPQDPTSLDCVEPLGMLLEFSGDEIDSQQRLAMANEIVEITSYFPTTCRADILYALGLAIDVFGTVADYTSAQRAYTNANLMMMAAEHEHYFAVGSVCLAYGDCLTAQSLGAQAVAVLRCGKAMLEAGEYHKAPHWLYLDLVESLIDGLRQCASFDEAQALSRRWDIEEREE